MSRITRTLTAKRDLKAHADFVAEQTRSVRIAEQFVERINQRIKLCAQFPEIGELCPNLGDDVRRVIAGNHLIFYERTKQGIRVLRILHGRQDISSVW